LAVAPPFVALAITAREALRAIKIVGGGIALQG
jgi:hypothetical protein